MSVTPSTLLFPGPSTTRSCYYNALSHHRLLRKKANWPLHETINLRKIFPPLFFLLLKYWVPSMQKLTETVKVILFLNSSRFPIIHFLNVSDTFSLMFLDFNSNLQGFLVCPWGFVQCRFAVFISYVCLCLWIHMRVLSYMKPEKTLRCHSRAALHLYFETSLELYRLASLSG